MIKIQSCSAGAIGANMYIITDAATGSSALVDCPAMGLQELLFLKKHGVRTLAYILLTHGHFDHILGAAEAVGRFGGKVVIHAADEACLRDERLSLCSSFTPGKQKPLTADVEVQDGDVLHLGETEIRVLSTPGHTKGSVCFLTEDVLFSGDTLFAGSCGRTDFPGGSVADMHASLQRIAALPGEKRVLPGHGSETSLESERRHNPFMKAGRG